MQQDLAIIIPVYNEGGSIRETIKQINDKVLGRYHIYMIYDFDEDSTLPHLKSYPGESLTLIKNKYGRGVLNAIKTGFEETHEPYAVVFMADLSEDPKYINDMMRKAKEGFDIVCGSRYMRGGAQEGAPIIKSLLSRLAGLSLNLIAKIPTHDISNSFKLYSRKALDSVKIESTGGFEIGMEITVKGFVNGLKITEVPVEWKERASGKSNFKFSKWLPKYLKWYFYLIRNKLFRSIQ